jgi:hypothetical protein
MEKTLLQVVMGEDMFCLVTVVRKAKVRKALALTERTFYATLMWHNTLSLYVEGSIKLRWVFEKQRRIEKIELCDPEWKSLSGLSGQ